MSQLRVIERAIEAATLVLGSDKSCGYCQEICADFLAGASIDGDNPEILLQTMSRYYTLLPSAQKKALFVHGRPANHMTAIRSKHLRVRLSREGYRELHRQVPQRDGWRCQIFGRSQYLQVHTRSLAATRVATRSRI